MKYLLDTNTCIRYINGRAPSIREHMQTNLDADIAISTVTKGEMFAGSAKSQTPERSRAAQDAFFIRFASLTFDEAALEIAGTPIGSYDMQIAAIALVHGLIVITHNTREFSRIAGLQIEDWEA